MTGSVWFYSKDEATHFNSDMVDCNTFKSFKYVAKLLGNIETDGANWILKNTTISVLINFWRSLEIALINCKFN